MTRASCRPRFAVALLLVAAVLQGHATAAGAAAIRPGSPSVPVQPAGRVDPPRPLERSAPPLRTPVWPRASQAVVNLATVKPGTLAAGAPLTGGVVAPVVKVGPVVAVGAPAAVAVQTLDAAEVAPAGGVALGVRVSRADRVAAPVPVAVSIDVSEFAQAYGGDFAARLRLVEAPACALSTPDAAACRARTVLRSTYDPAAGTVSATVTATGDPVATRTAVAAPVVIMQATASSTYGDFGQTDLKPSAFWDVSGNSGNFSYHVPIQLPPSPLGDTPSMSLDYSSQSIDGLTSATNTQTDDAGLGWSLPVSYIERHFRACSDDGAAATVGDLCWDTPYSGSGKAADAYYTMTLNGVASVLVPDPVTPTVFHTTADPGWLIQHLTGVSNGDNDGEFWVITTQNGTRYYMGIGHRNPDGVATNAVATVPVFGNDTGEPNCGSASTPCTQAYRWYLDREIDTKGADQAYMYRADANNYYSTMSTPTERSYTASTHLTEIDYGWADAASGWTTYTDKAVFAYAGRCTDLMSDTDPLHSGISPTCPSLTGSPSHYPDTPADMYCAAGDANKCATHSSTPVFYTGLMLWSVTTWVMPAGGTASKVQTYQLRHHFHVASGATRSQLVLDFVQRESWGAGGTGLTLPTVSFYGVDYSNSVQTSLSELAFSRIGIIYTDLGAQINITYGQPDPCSVSSLPNEVTNTKDCFTQQWTPPGGSPTWGWFNKWLVTTVAVNPKFGVGSGNDGAPVQTTTYIYTANKAGWRFTGNPMVPNARESWSDWRGYPSMRTVTGTGSQVRTTVTYILRGLDGDRIVRDPTGPSDYRTVTATGTTGVSVPDYPFFQSRPLEEVTRDSAAKDETYVIHGYTHAQINSYGGLPESAFVWENRVTTRTRLSTSTDSDSTWRQHVVNTFYDPNDQASNKFNEPLWVEDLGDSAVTGDETCTTYAYAYNTDTFGPPLNIGHWQALTDDTRHYHSTCAAPSAANQDGETQVLFDGNTSLASNKPSRGLPTRTMTSTDAATVVTTAASYDAAGRVVTATDGRGNVTTTGYSPATYWPTGGITVTTPAPDPSGATGSATGLATTTVTAPAFGQTTSVTDPNGRTATVGYDPAGRRTGVWMPTEPTTGPASVTYSYLIPVLVPSSTPDFVNGPAVITTNTLQQATPTPVYLTSYTYADGLGRVRETQQPSPTGTGRVVKTTRYDDAGDVAGSTPTAFYNSGAAGSGMMNPTLTTLPSYQQVTTDWAGRTTRTQLLAAGVASPKGDTGTTYPGADYHTVTDPDGHATDTYTDVFDRISKIVQKTPDLTPTSITTLYAYDTFGKLTSVTDNAGHVGSTTYDWAGRPVSGHDPDAGDTATTYDANGNVTSTTDAAGQKVLTVYDAINRPTATWLTAVGTGTQLSALTYDTATLGRGKPAGSTAYDGGLAYKTSVGAYDADGRALTTTVDVPTSEGFGGPVTTTVGYDAAGHQTTLAYPATGTGNVALPAETVTTTYTAGLPTSVASSLGVAYGTAAFADYDGHITARTWGGAATDPRRAYTRDPLTFALTNIRTQTGPAATPTTVQDDTYTYDNAGNLVENASATDGQQQCYAYDDLDRLTTAFTTTTASTTSCGGAAADHTGGIAPYDLGYAYDPLGDITSTVDRITNVTSTYAYGDAAHAHAVTAVTRTGGATGTDSYGYNAYGAQNTRTVAGVAGTVTYTPQGRAKAVTKGGATTTYVYDAAGGILLRTTATDKVLFLPGQELHLSGTVVRPTRYYRDGDSVIGQRVGDATSPTGVLTWLANDSQASAQLSINVTTLAVTRQRYLPFGAQRGTQGPPPGSQRGFLGRDSDPTSGLVEDGARLYDPAVGVMLSVDPVPHPYDPGQLDPYGYGRDNPLKFVDPTGLDAVACIDICTKDQSGTYGHANKPQAPAPSPDPYDPFPDLRPGGCRMPVPGACAWRTGDPKPKYIRTANLDNGADAFALGRVHDQDGTCSTFELQIVCYNTKGLFTSTDPQTIGDFLLLPYGPGKLSAWLLWGFADRAVLNMHGKDGNALGYDLFTHEARHSDQYTRYPHVTLYGAAYGLDALGSWIYSRNPALYNPFEIHAGLFNGNYVRRSLDFTAVYGGQISALTIINFYSLGK